MTTKENANNYLSRRTMLRYAAGAGAAAFVGANADLIGLLRPGRGSVVSAETFDCVAKPELTEGPYFVDERLNRSDIRSDPSTGAVKRGVPLALTFRVHRIDSGACTPLAGAYVDVWHTDALGSYSDISSEGTSGQKYLRGYQVTDDTGAAEFTTIYPGWYRGRTIHIHFKIRVFSGSQQAYEFTSQLFFDESTTAAVAAVSPYSQKGTPDTSNSSDGIFRQSGGELTLTLTGSASAGYAATFDVGLVGVPATGGGDGGAPAIGAATVRKKKLVVTGSNFGSGAAILVDGEAQTTRNNAANPSAVLVAKGAGRLIPRGATVTLQVQNPDGTVSDGFSFTRPVG
jgi:protocatechuate 3,4-dioxygenase beta subunit